MNNFLKILQILNAIPMVIATVENLKNTSGKDKAKLVEQQVMNALEASELVTGRDIINEKDFRKGLRKAVDGMVQMLNSSSWKK